jgi:hypothetical protein
VPLTDPTDGLNVSQSTWRAFNVWLKVVVDVVESSVSNGLLGLLSGKEPGAWPETFTI